MILDETIKIKVNGKMVKKYRELGFNVKQNDFINLPVKYLSKYSHQKIKCACDICGEIKKVKYNNYYRYIEKDPNNQYTCKKCNLEKRKNTCLKKYGVDFVAKLKSSKEKAKETMKKNGTDFFFKTKKYKDKIIQLYGVENISQNEEIKKKKIKTYLIKYGVENPSQNEKIHKKQQSGFLIKDHKTGLKYRGSYEKDFIDYCFNNKIKIDNFKGYINYKMNGKNKKYFPDFYLKEKNLIIEIKSTYTYKKNLEKNLAKKEAAILNGFNFIFIIDKNYNNFKSIIQ